MLQNERQNRILDELEIHHAVKVNELAKQLDTSESTIRRDINELSQMGKLKKVFGGAISVSRGSAFVESDVASRARMNVEEKERIARYAASLIEDNDFVYLDAGTTTGRMIDFLEKKNVTYVTNGITHARRLIERGLPVFMIGGLLRPASEAVVGEAAIEAIRRFNFTKCFMGAKGLDAEKGFTTLDISEAAVKTAEKEKAGCTYMLADHTKFNLVSSVSFAALEDACIITDRLEDPRYRTLTEILEAPEHRDDIF